MALTTEDKLEILGMIKSAGNFAQVQKKRPHRRWENETVEEWRIARHPNALYWTRVRLGPIPNSEAGRTFNGLRRWADLVLYEDRTVYVIEAKMKPEPGALSQLELYLNLFAKTPEFSTFERRKVQGILLTTVEDEEVRRLAEGKGILFEVFKPSFFDEYIQTVINRTPTAYKQV